MINYAIVGGGRLARHFSQYFHLLEISHSRWTRDRGSSFNTSDIADAELRLRETIGRADRVLLLVSDNAIGALLKQYPFLHEKQLIHCSGALSFPGVAGAHPLMTFASDLYELETYQSVPFMLEAGYSFTGLFPGLSNPNFVINVEDKARYHAMCVMAGNFSQILWKGVSDRFEQQFDLPAETLHPYLQQLATNFVQNPGSALTGPLVRGDVQTIERNLNALSGDPLQDLYRAFVSYYQKDDRQSDLWGQAL
ncbi:MAG: DUF2520 domain-containing protein [Xanthomonadales bacterium]|nr:DUF2520 domain-containing protein [Xanthomonadales bacterium]